MNAERQGQKEMSKKPLRRTSSERTEEINALSVLGQAALGVVAALFARAHIVFGTYPLAFSLLAVVRGNPLFVFIGSVVGALTMPHDGFVYALFYLMLLGIRFLFSAPRGEKEGDGSMTEGYFRELPQLQIVALLLTGTGMAAWQLFRFGFTTHALLFSAAAVSVPAVCAALLVGAFAAELRLSDLFGTRQYRKGEVPFGGLSPLYVEVGLLTFFGALAYALSFYSVYGLSLGLIAATLFTLFVSRRFGALKGCVGGMLTALSVTPFYAPTFGVLGLLSGVVFPYGTGYGLTLGIGGATLLASYFGGAGGLLGVMPEMTISALLTWPLYMKMRRGMLVDEGGGGEDIAVTYAAQSVMMRSDKETDKLRLLSDALLSVSDTFRREGVAEESPDMAEYFSMCDKVCNRYCPQCAQRALCWEGEHRKGVEVIGRLSEELSHSGTVHLGQENYFPPYCQEEEHILRGIRAEAAALCGGKRKSAHSTLVATEYMMLSRLLADESSKRREESLENTPLSLRLQACLTEELPSLGDVTVLVKGKKRPVISVGTRAIQALGETVDEIRDIFERETCMRMEAPTFEEINRVGTLKMTCCRRFDVLAASAVSAYREGELSGDVISYFDDEAGGYLHALLSDGMGCGRRAARASQLVCGFLEQFLGAGCGVLPTVEMMHHMLRGRSEEASATVDLFSLDTFSGRAEFLKCGAVSSYIKRGDNLYRARVKTPPIGILREYDGETVSFDMQAGDIVIMLSDGICPDGEEQPWLFQLLNGNIREDLQRTAQQIVAMAAQKNDSEDDRSVLLLEIQERRTEEREAAESPHAA